jgi:hypothetical protein
LANLVTNPNGEDSSEEDEENVNIGAEDIF